MASSKQFDWVSDRNSLVHEVGERVCEAGFGGFGVIVGGKDILLVEAMVEGGGRG